MKPNAKINIEKVQKKVKPSTKSNNPFFHKKVTDERFTDSSEEDKKILYPMNYPMKVMT